MSGLFDQITNYSPPLLTAGQVNYKGTWNAATNSPTLVSPPASTSKGDYYVVSAAGTQFGITFAVGDWIISNGTAWEKVDLTDAVSSVFGRTGAITAASGDYTASQVTNVPAGVLVSTNVQDVVNELSANVAVAQRVMDAYVTNAESVAITKGQVVYAFSATGNRMSVKLANNSSDATSAKTIGVVLDSSIAAGNSGYIRVGGVVDGLTLGSFTDGDTVYLGATNGSITNVKPYAPNHLVYVGIVERANNGNGQLYVRIQNGYELDEIHDVQITSAPASGALLVRDATNSLWKAARLTAGTNIAVTNADASVTVGITGIIGSSNGGTGNGFTKFSGPTTSEKTFTLPNSNATLLYDGGALGTPSSGTVTNLTGTASININGTVGATTANTGAFTTLTSSFLAASGPLASFSVAQGLYGYYSSGGVIGAYSNNTGTLASLTLNGSSIDVRPAGSTVGLFSTTGLAVTGTLSTTGKGSIGTTATNEILNIDNGTGNAFIRFDKSGAFQGLVGIAQTAGQGSSGSAVGDIILRSQTNSLIDVAGTTIGKFSSTGLAVTGNIEGSGVIRTNAGAGTNKTASAAIDYSGGFHRAWCWGPDTSTVGQWKVRLAKSDGTSAVEPVAVSSTGLAVTGAVSATGGITSTFDNSSAQGINIRETTNASGAFFTVFRKADSTAIGSVARVTTTDAVVYNTTSDGRLKENFRDFTDSGRLIDSLKPRVFDWKNSDENGKNVVGFIAQETNAADPIFAHIGAVSVGDGDPEIITKQWQRSDSALIPILVAELKNVRQRLAALEAK